MIKKLFVIGISIFLFSCSSPMDKKFNEETAKEDIQAIKTKIDSTELQLLAGTMMRLKFQDKKLENMTYAEILDNGKSSKRKLKQNKKLLQKKL